MTALNKNFEHHTVLKSILLHLLPGLILLASYLIFAPILFKIELPPFLAVILIAGFIVSPFEWWILYREAKAGNAKIKELVHYFKPLVWWQYLLIILALLSWAVLVAGIVTPLIEIPFSKSIHSLTPNWFDASNLKNYNVSVLTVVFVLRITILSIISPIIEELYFRGYLLPRMPKQFGQFSNVIHTVLFSLQHFIQPEGNLSRTLVALPVVYCVKWKKNIFISIIWHCLLNLLSAISMLQLLRLAS